MYLSRLFPRRSANDLPRLGLVAVVLFSLVSSDLVAMRHVGSCCRNGQLTASGPVAGEQAGRGAHVRSLVGCGHEGCHHGKPALHAAVGDAGVDRAIEGEPRPTYPCSPEHDQNRCAVCHWFAVLSGGLHFDGPVIAECGELVDEPILIVAGLPSEMIFLPTVSRRGPPAVA